MHVRTWHVELYLTEDDGHTAARAVLHTDGPQPVVGTGHAERSREDPSVPEIGDEFATGRALRDLSERLLDLAQEDLNRISVGAYRAD